MSLNADDLKGIIPAVIVPMDKDFRIDFEAYRHYLNWLLKFDITGFAVNVDTGEGPYLSADERAEVIRVTREVAAGRCKVIAGCGGPSTQAAVANAIAARDAGADGLLVFPTPAFTAKPLDPRVPVDYHRAIAEASGLPIILFQLGTVFGGIILDEPALERMLDMPQVIGMKDASFDGGIYTRTRDLIRAANHPVTLLSGNDNFLLESFLLGAEGGLLGFGAVGAPMLVEMLDAVKAKRFDEAAAMQARVQGFCDYIYGIPVADYRARCKVALVHMGVLPPELTFVRPPYLSLWEAENAKAKVAVETFDAIYP